MWNIYEEKFIHNDAQYEVVLIISGILSYEDVELEAKELYKSLTSQEINYIKKRLNKNRNR